MDRADDGDVDYAPPVQHSIRHATADDAAAIAAIYNHAVRETTGTWDEVEHTTEQRRAWLKGLGDTECVLVAEVDGIVAGWVSLTAVNARSGWRFTRSESVYIDPGHQGQGLGRALLAAMLMEAHARGIRSVIATISSDNERSLALHKELGFELRGTLQQVGYKFGRWLDVNYLQAMLGPGYAETDD